MVVKMRDRRDSFLSKSAVFEPKDSNNGYAINSNKVNSKLLPKGMFSLAVVSNIRPVENKMLGSWFLDFGIWNLEFGIWILTTLPVSYREYVCTI